MSQPVQPARQPGRHNSNSQHIVLPDGCKLTPEEPQSPQPPRLACSWSRNCSLTPGRGPKASSPKTKQEDPLRLHFPGKPQEEE